MSRSSRSRRQPALRDATDIASSAGSALWADGFERDRQRRSERWETLRAWSARTMLSLIEDRRSSHPDGPYRSPRSVDRARQRFVAVTPRAPYRRLPTYSVPSRIGFREPSRVAICIRRHARREVMFALRRTGRGAGRSPHRYTPYSLVRC